MNLIIVESPTKARTLSRFLGKGYAVEATMGHIKDLPKSKLSVDVENNFEPEYLAVERQAKTIKTLVASAKKAKTVYLATDPDREGEAISAHVEEILSENKLGKEIKRIVFHEITKSAVEEAINHPRQVDKHLVDAQVARRVLDRLVGYKLSPLLWKKVRRGLSAGRVQSVAVRLIVEREREIEAFTPVEYWEIASEVAKSGRKSPFIVQLAKIDGKKAEISNGSEAEKIVTDLKAANHIVSDVKRREARKRPFPPFTTSTMSQAAANLFGWTARRTMSVAQKLYEEGLITYHRTDSLSLSAQSVSSARSYIEKKYGKNYIPNTPRFYKTRSKSAQEAHEAIRPTDVHTLASEHTFHTNDMKKLYDIIWKRFVACQMAEVVYDQTTIEVTAANYLLRASGQVEKFAGWRVVMPKSKKASKVNDGDEILLPEVAIGENLDLLNVLSEQKFTQPPARYNEASLIKTLETLGIGRPSTYAPTIFTIQVRNYVEKKDNKFFATPIGTAVTDFLLKNFPNTFEYEFTALMEGNLDKVAEGKLSWREDLKNFYTPFEKKLGEVEKNAERVKIEVEKIGEMCPECGTEEKGEQVIRIGRFGKFISCSRFPECKYTAKYVEKIDMECPTCGEGQVIVKKTGKGRTFFGCSRYPDCDWASWKNPKKEAVEGD